MIRPPTLRALRPRVTMTRSLATLGIRREDPRRVWERRSPLTPEAVAQLTDKASVEVESCSRRCFPDSAYAAAGAKIVPKLSKDVNLVLGIKEPRVEDVHALIDSDRSVKRTWMMFSHTHKGQPYNTQLLSAFLPPSKGQTLIDHELLTSPGKDGKLRRVAAFGWFAGAVGAGEALSLTGQALLRRGMSHPLLHLARPFTYTSLDEFKAALKRAGDATELAALRKASDPSLTPDTEGPVVIGLTGAGNVSTGSRDMLDEAGVQWVDWTQLPNLKPGPKIYACALPPYSYLQRKTVGGYDRIEYYAHPDMYESTFTERIAPYITTLIHGAGWQEGFPRIMTNADMDRYLAESKGKQKMIALQDVTCDVEGALEFMNHYTTIDEPVFEGPGGILIGSTDVLPTELPADSSTYFSGRLMPYVERAVEQANGKPIVNDDIDQTLERARIVSNSELGEKHEWLQENVDKWRATQSVGLLPQKKKVLLLGSGLVAGPAVEVFLKRPDVQLVIASNNLAEAEALARNRRNVSTRSLDVSDNAALGEAVAGADVIVSLLPAPMHVQVARHCIANGRHLVTASYVSPEMKELDAEAKAKDVLLLGECGLDPGIDSMAAMRIMERVHKEGKKVVSFVSWCGGLPEASASNVPLAYKFSWSPKAVLTASLNDAEFKLNGEMHKVRGQDLLREHFPDVKLWRGLALEGVANRDSLPYAEKYGLGSVRDLRDLFRGTLRYQGFSHLMDRFRALGLLGTEKIEVAGSWPGFLAASMTLALGREVKEEDLLAVVEETTSADEELLEALQYFSLLPSKAATGAPAPPALPKMPQAPIDTFAALLSKKLAYANDEHDAVLLHHAFKVVPAGSSDWVGEQTVTASLLCTGDERASAMSTTVGCTLAFAALRVADGLVQVRGVTGPYTKDVWAGVLDELEHIGVKVKERWV
ncbi:uncharacterized protein CcaverHIS019_0601920 [Cutaneotrichosporon cavernicola]|uniref:Saccharopine dehydrogenase (NAD(+), L-glutamate-forming) n=1 Tax=Cutaneotrichosporon cavernicola TaxID=279322 RepID=A0AA48L8B2_9TREE|nr:uncharacterized protein CcaverHIS019_0601920 [Cutaneotrichosporon cavernicola]BEI93733.1 hypothetical protein CcaverHIS019_0601920 [Cutaneotrichosporon cavernicola]BEJ01511.1 hypothetical protein CcaverHIS631_0601930 [Cutaneotrichosporon cavernicola]